MDTLHGHVTAVSQKIRGDEVRSLSGDDGFLYVYDTADFYESGGWLRTTDDGGAEVFVEYTGLAGPDFPGSGHGWPTILLATPVSVAEGTRVEVWNPATQDVVSEWLATVTDDVDGTAIVATVSHELVDKLGDGIRGILGESVVCEHDPQDDDWVLTRVLGKTPETDGTFIDPGTLPDSAPTEEPAASPVPIVDSGSGAAVVRWTSVDDATAYDLHLSSSNAVTPGPATLLMADAHSPSWVSKDQTGNPLATDTDVYFALVARNAIGPAPASPWVAGRPGPISQQVLAASLALVQNVVAQLVETQGLQIGEGSWKAGTGLDIPGVVHFPVDGQVDSASVQAAMFARSLVIENYFSMRGTINSLEAGSRLALDAGVTAPQVPPVVSQFWPSQPSIPGTGVPTGWETVGIACNYNGTTPNVWVRAEYFSGGAGAPSRLVVYTEGNPTPTIISGFPGNIVDIGYNKGRWFALVHMKGWATEDWRVHSWPADFSTRREDVIAPPGHYSRRPAIVANDDLVTSGNPYINIVGRESDGVYRMRRHEFISGDLQEIPGGMFFFSLATAYDLGGAAEDPVGDGIIIFPATSNARVYDRDSANVAMPELTAEGFPRAAGRTVAGVTFAPRTPTSEWGTTAFLSVEPDGTMHRYSRSKWAHKAVYTWYDSVGTTHETTPSPESAIAAAHRSSIRITIPNVPAAGGGESPDQARIYVGTTAGTPRLQGHVVEGETVIEFMQVDTTVPTTPPATNGFENTAADPAELAAVTGGFFIDGNSNGAIGTGTFRDSVLAAGRDVLPGILSRSERSRSTAQSIPNDTPTAVLFPDLTLERGIAYSSGTFQLSGGPAGGPGRIYEVNTVINLAANTTGRRLLRLMLNGVNRDLVNISAPNTGQAILAAADKFTVPAGATWPLSVEVRHNITGGGALDVVGGRVTVAEALS